VTYRFVDCRWELGKPDRGRELYLAGHIPGASFLDVERDLSAPPARPGGRHPLPSPEDFARAAGTAGIGPGVLVVAYDQGRTGGAARLWWLLRHLGHDEVAVLDGGIAVWLGRLRSGEEEIATAEFTPRPRTDDTIEAEELHARLGEDGLLVLDARVPERFRGEVEPIDRVPGHIPGAINHFFQSNLDEHGTFRSAEDLRDRFRRSIGDAGVEHVVCYCGSGVTACHNLLALEHAGMTGAKLYPGSWSEWSSNPARPIERNEAGESRD
jgi:thiosulfate/3-mercaptopyruvate sulfurtransferase